MVCMFAFTFMKAYDGLAGSNSPSSSTASLWVSATQECGPVFQGLPHFGYGSDGLFICLTLV